MWFIYSLLLVFLLVPLCRSSEKSESSVATYLRRLAGSNCIEIERGIVTPFYACDGCLLQEANECLNDLRLNKSSNVRAGCPINKAFTVNPGPVCCPTISDDLEFVGSNYPLALRCIEKVKCASTTIYAQLLRECQTICPGRDPRSGSSVCYADFNAAFSTMKVPSKGFILLLSIVCVLLSSFI